MAQHDPLSHWLEQRISQWQNFEMRLRRQITQRHTRIEDAMALVVQYRDLARDLSLARSLLPNSRLANLLQSLFMSAHEVIYRPPLHLGQQLVNLIVIDIPLIVRRLRSAIIATFSIFLLSALCGWLLVFNYPPLASLFASEAMINTVQSGDLWTDNLLSIFPAAWLSVSIMTNNIIVAITAFVLGAFYGLGTLYIIGMNGLMLGGIFAFTREYDMAGALFKFVVAHGVVELSVICLAGAAGISLGEALIRPGANSRASAFQQAVQQGGKMLLVCVVFLVGAGIIEGNVSPNEDFTLTSRLLIGLGYGAVLYVVMTGAWRSGKTTAFRRTT